MFIVADLVSLRQKHVVNSLMKLAPDMLRERERERGREREGGEKERHADRQAYTYIET